MRIYRKAKNLTQKQLSIKTEVSQGTITRAEKGGNISVIPAIKIARSLEVDVTDLYNPYVPEEKLIKRALEKTFPTRPSKADN